MLGSPCNPCCDQTCNCGTRCALCFTLSDGTTTWDSCSSISWNGDPPTRYDGCNALTTQPIETATTQAALGEIGRLVDKTSFIAAPFIPIRTGDYGGTAFYEDTNDFDGAVYATELGSSSATVGANTSMFCVVLLKCLNSTSSLPARHVLSVLYSLTITKTTTVSGVIKTQRTVIQSQTSAVGGVTFGSNVVSDSRAGFTNVIGCTGATISCLGSSGTFLMSDFDVEASVDGVEISINDGLFVASYPELTVTEQICNTRNIDGTNIQNCSDYLTIADALFSPPTITATMNNQGQCLGANPLP